MDARATRESTRDKWDLGEVTETHGSETGHLLGGIGQHFKLTGSLLIRSLSGSPSKTNRRTETLRKKHPQSKRSVCHGDAAHGKGYKDDLFQGRMTCVSSRNFHAHPTDICQPSAIHVKIYT